MEMLLKSVSLFTQAARDVCLFVLAPNVCTMSVKKPQVRPWIHAELAAGIQKAERFTAATQKQTKGSSCRV